MDLDSLYIFMRDVAHAATEKLFGSGVPSLDAQIPEFAERPSPRMVEVMPCYSIGEIPRRFFSSQWEKLEDFKIELIKLEGKFEISTICWERSAEDATVELFFVVAQQQADRWQDALELVCKYEAEQMLPVFHYKSPGVAFFFGGYGYKLKVAPGALVWLIRVASRGPVSISDPAREFAQELEKCWWEAILEDSFHSSPKAPPAPK